MLERTSTTERYTRGVAAAVVAVATLILAANAGPARAADPGPAYQVRDAVQTQDTVRAGP
ncbi:hypothetical protein J7F01_19315 [Streptomyces sp. ISL-22]|uniref:hypothetical protein n=1 Tax=unclassified Streptomyces TaxID=2593676 RepID=UPI001BE58E4A|nr:MULTISPECIES: hypothetical protein [unclassified Streptomyces]MBT2418613.1 hypothetical protein [Streptomyces sp. ISL-24]MBT2434284.1 hypothetical protein [Streptomyces sp. ISL-22]